MGWWEEVTGQGSAGGGTYDTNTGRYAPIPAVQSDKLRRQREETPPTYPTSGMATTTSGSGGGGTQSLSTSTEGMATQSADSGDGGGTASPTPTSPTPTGPTPEQQLKQEQDAAWASALARLQGYGQQQVSDRALDAALIDQYGVLDAYAQALGLATDSFDPYSVSDPSVDAYYNKFAPNNYFNDALEVGRTQYRNDLTGLLNDAAAEGFEYDAFGDTADDAILQAILDTQRGDAQAVLTRAHARGQLNDTGYSRATNELDAQGKAGMSSLQSVGGGVLADYRNQLANVRNNALTRIGTASFAQPYNVGSVIDRLNQMKQQFQSSLENDIYGAVGGSDYFSTSNAISRGGSTQGMTNPSRLSAEGTGNGSFEENNPLLQTFASGAARPQKRFVNNSGSLATTGVF